MRGISTELKVGSFAIFVLCILAFMTFKVGGLDWTKKKGYTLHAFFTQTAGLDEKTKVKVAGVDAGTIQSIELVEGRARVSLLMDPGVKVYRDAVVAIKSSGLLGDKFLNISVGSAGSPQLNNGDTIANVVEIVDIDDVARKILDVSKNFSDLAESINDVIGSEESKEALRQTIVNLRETTSNLSQAVAVNDTKLRSVLDNIDSMTAALGRLVEENRGNVTATVSNMKDLTGSLKTDAPKLVENLNTATKELRAMVEENRPAVKTAVESFSSITSRIDKGEGSLGKLVKDDRLYESANSAVSGLGKTLAAIDRFRTFITFQGDYLLKPKDSKGQFYVTLQPRQDKYYILGVVRDPIGRTTTKETTTLPPGTVVREEVVENKIEFTAQFAKRFGDAAVRAGLTENTFGAGADYFLYNDRLKVSADVWDFSNEENGSQHPHVRVGLDYFFFKNLFISGGVDNILNKKWRGGFVGGGVRFEDEDFKYLFGNLSKIPTN